MIAVVKFGGGAITHKDKDGTLRMEAINNLCRQVAAFINEDGGKVVVVHGGGSFGHPVAKRYGLKDGIKGYESYRGVCETRQAMRNLNGAVVERLMEYGARPFTIEPASSFITRDGELKEYYGRIVELALKNDFTPVLHGDVVLDLGERRISILSGDVIASQLAIDLKAESLIYVIDVDGIYTDDPTSPEAKLIEQLDRGAIESLKLKLVRSTGESSRHDVTGGVLRKLEEGWRAYAKGVSHVYFVKWCEDRLLEALRGTKPVGTIIRG
ncbi:MAG: hypothetical protein DRJ68_02270 [Thermoprotei archaeon]|nr:MAG: hypothetical protein DRJ68_02270 [Thermoprotei archaeon]